MTPHEHKELEAFELTISAPCEYCTGSGIQSVVFGTIWCTHCGGSGLQATYAANEDGSPYMYINRYVNSEPKPYRGEYPEIYALLTRMKV